MSGLRGMAWACAALLGTGMTASKASIFFRPATYANGNPCTATPSSKIFYQYLRGLRAPIPGARGKYGYDLVDEVDRYPGAQGAKVWLNLPLWELVEAQLTLDEIQHALDAMPSGANAGSLDRYVRAWAEFRLAQLRNGTQEELAVLASRIAVLHRPLYDAEPVFRYIFEPYVAMLTLLEPSVVLRSDSPIRPARDMENVEITLVLPGQSEEARAYRKRFWIKAARLIRSGERPPESFLAEFEDPWFRLLEAAMRDRDGAVERLRLGLAPTYRVLMWPELLARVFPAAYAMTVVLPPNVRPPKAHGSPETRIILLQFDRKTRRAHGLLQRFDSPMSSLAEFIEFERAKWEKHMAKCFSGRAGNGNGRSLK
ncbi:hypothetical protein [Paraburkholderia sp. J76]|uniref:hypothetical protein n=1 Tax=Paraburkholderia sp. J76 TaxID=2805439 RepID=UPI002ABE4737|nr:hypothetical protein [Paraburkholderia sp. J76]